MWPKAALQYQALSEKVLSLMSDKVTRGKQSKIDQLPEPVRDYLHEMLRSGASQSDILEKINAAIIEAGLDDDDKLSRSGLSRYACKMEKLGSQIRETREVAEAWIARLGTKPTGEVTQLLIELLRTAHFKLLMKTAEDPDEVLDPETLGDLALSIGRLEKAAMLGTQREKELRKAFAEEAATQAETAARAAGLTKAGAQAIKNQILGIA